MTTSLSQLIEQTSDMVSLPQVSIRINEMVNSGNYKAADVGKLISQDPGLTVRLLKVANSP
ncbi:MAG: HDOD domain-containing protein, partial [Gammaproteobacteria bacterium]|nr:HDOD domain-containing protein [Gammaproteobacteria bacterium]